MRIAICDRCTNQITDIDEITLIQVTSALSKVISDYELCENCKVEFYDFLRNKKGEKDA